MASWARTRLLAAAGFLLLSLLPWQVQAGTTDAPEITDAAGDQELLVVPVGEADQFTTADVLKAWLTETADELLVHILVSGAGTTSTTTEYSWELHIGVAGQERLASATSTSDQPTPAGEASAATRDGSTITITLSKATLGIAAGMTLTGIAIEAEGVLLETGVLAVTDTAPDDGVDAGISYTVTGGGSAGTPGDADGDGLNDTEEVRQFGNITRYNGTSDPDADGLNNTREFAIGTNATNADTDGDGLPDGEDPDPLVPAGAASDTDGDGLNDTWEREHFTTLPAQNGTGDPDDDDLNNTRELALGTDPNEADTDGDGLDDGEDPAPLVPNADGAEENGERKTRPELYSGAAMFAVAATFILLGLAKGL